MGKEKACSWNWNLAVESGEHCIRPRLATRAHQSLTLNGEARGAHGKSRVWTEPSRTRGLWQGDAGWEKNPEERKSQANTQRQGGVVWLMWYVCWKAGVMVPWGERTIAQRQITRDLKLLTNEANLYFFKKGKQAKTFQILSDRVRTLLFKGEIGKEKTEVKDSGEGLAKWPQQPGVRWPALQEGDQWRQLWRQNQQVGDKRDLQRDTKQCSLVSKWITMKVTVMSVEIYNHKRQGSIKVGPQGGGCAFSRMAEMGMRVDWPRGDVCRRPEASASKWGTDLWVSCSDKDSHARRTATML